MSQKTFVQLNDQTIKGAALLQLLQGSAGADDVAAIVYGGSASFTAGQGNAVTAQAGLTAATAVWTEGTEGPGQNIVTLSAVTGVALAGDTLTDGVNTVKIVGPVVPGTSGAGQYYVSGEVPAWASATSVTSTSLTLTVTALTANDAPLLSPNGSVAIGTFGTGGSFVAASVVSQLVPNSNGFTGETLGGVGRYTVSVAQSAASATLDISTATIHVTTVASGVIGGGNALGGTGTGTVVDQILPLATGEAEGGIGRYFVSDVAYVASASGWTTAAGTAMVDGDYICLFDGSWTGRPKYEFNQDTFSKFGRKFIVKLFATTGLTLGDSSLNNTNLGNANNPDVYGIVRQVTITGHGFSPGNVFMVGTEAFLVLNVDDVNHVDVFRGYAGTTAAAHASGATVLTTASYSNVNVGYDLIVPVTALALATSAPQFVKAMKALDGWNAKWFGSVGVGIKQTLNAKKLYLDWEYDSTSASETRILFHRLSVSGSLGPSAGAAYGFPSTTTVGANSLQGGSAPQGTSVYILASITNGACPTAMTPGVQPAEVGWSSQTRVLSATELAQNGGFGLMDFAFPYPVKTFNILAAASAGAVNAPNANWTTTASADGRRISVLGVSGHTLGTAGTSLVGVEVFF